MKDFILYFRKRADFNDTKTWAKEILPSDFTIEEVRKATYYAGCEGFAIVRNNKIETMEWLAVKKKK
jgi:hypothetical protein